MAKNTANYGNDSIRQLKDEERVRLRPAVIFGSDGLDGCAHAAFEILSNAVDEARQGYGKLITLTAFRDGSIQVEDNGRGCPLDWNPSEKRFNSRLSPATRTAPAPLSSGAPILRSLPQLASPTIGIARPCVVRPWSTPT